MKKNFCETKKEKKDMIFICAAPDPQKCLHFLGFGDKQKCFFSVDGRCYSNTARNSGKKSD